MAIVYELSGQPTYMSPPSIEIASIGFLAGHLVRLAIRTNDYIYFKILQYSEVTDNAWSVSKHVSKQRIILLKLKVKVRIKLEIQRLKLEIQRKKLEIQRIIFEFQRIKLEIQRLKLEIQRIKLKIQTLIFEFQTIKLEERKLFFSKWH